MCSCNMNRIYKWVLLFSTHSETPSECPVIFVAVVHRMSKSDRNIGVVLFDCLSFISGGNVSNMWQQCRVACKTSNFKVSFPLILLTQQDSSCSTIAAEEGEKIQVWTDDRNCFSARSSNFSPLVFYPWSLNHSLCPKNIRLDLWSQCNSNIIKMHWWFEKLMTFYQSPLKAHN